MQHDEVIVSLRRCLLFPMCLGDKGIESHGATWAAAAWTKAASMGIQQDEGWNLYSPGLLAADSMGISSPFCMQFMVSAHSLADKDT